MRVCVCVRARAHVCVYMGCVCVFVRVSCWIIDLLESSMYVLLILPKGGDNILAEKFVDPTHYNDKIIKLLWQKHIPRNFSLYHK